MVREYVFLLDPAGNDATRMPVVSTVRVKRLAIHAGSKSMQSSDALARAVEDKFSPAAIVPA